MVRGWSSCAGAARPHGSNLMKRSPTFRWARELLLMFDDFSDASRERLHLEWLRDDEHSLFEAAASDRGVFSITGDEQHLEVGPAHARGIRHLAPVQAVWQPDIGNQ